MKEKIRHMISPHNIFLVMNVSGLLLFIMFAPVVRMKIFDWISMENNSIWASKDYFRHLFYSRNLGSCYGSAGDTVFSPLAYILYHFVYRASTTAGTVVDDMNQMLVMPYQNIVFMMYSLIGILLLLFDIELLRISPKRKWLLFISVLFSVPVFWGGIERGNLTVHCAAILVMGILLKDSEKNVHKEVALLLIAFGAALKIYVAAAGLIYVSEKRWREVGRLIVYGGVLFFAPFVFLGGVDGFYRYIRTITGYTKPEYEDRIEFIQGLLNYYNIAGKSAKILVVMFALVLIVLLLTTKNMFRQTAFLSGLLVFVPGNAYRYALVYFLLPLCMFMKKEDNDLRDYINAVLLGGIFSVPTVLGLLNRFRLAYGTYAMTCVEVYIYFFAWLFLLFNVIVEVFNRGKKNI